MHTLKEKKHYMHSKTLGIILQNIAARNPLLSDHVCFLPLDQPLESIVAVRGDPKVLADLYIQPATVTDLWGQRRACPTCQ
jgi:hypothetical protein